MPIGIYTKHKIIETAMIHILNHIHLSAASPHSSVVILLDLSAAFDTLDHNILINRLTSIGISDTVLARSNRDWFISYLTGRFYQISINSLIFKPIKVTSEYLKDLSLFQYCSISIYFLYLNY